MIGLLFVILLFLFWLIPIILVAKSNRTEGGEKVAWVLLIIFVSWLAWIFYLLLAPLKPEHTKLNNH
jgi:hypothetical protein